MNNSEWILINENEIKIHPLHEKITLRDDASCDIKLWRTKITKNEIDFFIGKEHVILFLNGKKLKTKINQEQAKCKFVLLGEGDFITLGSYRFQVAKRTSSEDEKATLEIFERNRIKPNTRPVKSVRPNEKPIATRKLCQQLKIGGKRFARTIGYTNGTLEEIICPVQKNCQ